MAGKRVLSIEFGVQTSRICEIEIAGVKQTVFNSCTFETPDGAIEDGYIQNKDILGIAVKTALKNGFSPNTKQVVFSISSSKIANREVNTDKMPDNKIQDYIQINAKDYFPIEIDKYVITYKKLETIKQGDKEKLRLLVLAAPNDLIETYYELSDAIGVEIKDIDYSGNSSFQMLKKQNIKGVNIYVQLNENNTLINIMNNNILTLQRTVPYGVNSIVDAAVNCGEFGIVDKASAYQKLFTDTLVNPRLNESAIDDVAISYMDSNNDAYSQQIRQMKAKDEITDALSYLVNNTIRVLDYYASKYPDKKVDNLFIIGLGSKIKGIIPLFKNEVYAEVKKLDNLFGMTFAPSARLSNEDKSVYISPLGAVIEPVNFVPKAQAEKTRKKQQSKTLNLGLIGGTVVAIAILISSIFMFTLKKIDLNSKKREWESYAKTRTVIEENDKAKNKNRNAKDIFIKTMGYTYVMNILFKELEKSIPSNTIISNFEYQEGTISLNVETNTLKEVGQFIINVKKCNLVEDVQVTAVSYQGELGKKSSYEFAAVVIPKTLDYTVFLNEEMVPPDEDDIKKIVGNEK